MYIDLNLQDVYRASDVNRWQIVKHLRTQSLSDHSFQVAMIAIRVRQVAQEMGYQMGSADLGEVLVAALTHDLPEVLTGDMASPLKRLLGKDFTEALHQFERRVRVLGLACGGDAIHTHQIVKIADTVEAIKYLSQNAATDHGRSVMQGLIGSLSTYGPVAMRVLDEVLNGPITTLDDVVRERQKSWE